MVAAAETKVGSANRNYARGLARAFAGAVIFSLPLLMTMEMWWLGFYMARPQLIIFCLVNFLVLVGLSRVSGFEETHSRLEDVLDAFAAYAVAAVCSLAILAIFGIIDAGMPVGEIAGKVAVQTVPAGFGAMIASKQLGSSDESEQLDRWRTTYPGQLFLMLAGALFLSFNVAPTEEMVLISYRMTPLHALILVLLSILLLHAFVYSVGFTGQKEHGDRSFASVLVHYTLGGYAIAVAVSLYVLWTFGRTEGVPIAQIAMMTAVLAFPSALGAAIARLVV